MPTMTVIFVSRYGITSQVYTSDYTYKLEEIKKKLETDFRGIFSLHFSIS